MKLAYAAILLVMIACSQKKTETAKPQMSAADSAINENRRRAGIWKSLGPLPTLKPPLKLSISGELGTPIPSDCTLYKILSTNAALPTVKRAIGKISNPNDAYVFWIGKGQGDGGIWRLFFTNVSDPRFDPHPVTSELDAAGQEIERCSAGVIEHWTAINEHLESRSMIRLSKGCVSDTVVEITRTRQIAVNGAYDEAMPHPFTNIPLQLPASSEPIESDTMQWYFNGGYLGPYLSKVFFKDRPLLFNFELIKWTTVPDTLDGRLFFALTRNGIPDAKNPSGQKATEFSFLSGEKVGYKTYRIGQPATFGLPMMDDPNLVSELLEFEPLHDHFLRITGVYGVPPQAREKYTRYIIRYGYDLKFLGDLSAEMLRLERNYLFARYGYAFKAQDLADYFKQFKWYKPGTSSAEQITNMLSADDKALLDQIKRLEERASTQ